MGRILVAGTVAFDHVCLGPRIAAPNTTVLLERHRQLPGGAAGNVAMALARLGAAAPRLAAAVGPDFQGSAYERDLIEGGVDLTALARVSAPTACAFIFNEPGGNQCIYFHAGASERFAECAPGDADYGHFAAGDILNYPAHMRRCREVSFDPGQEVFHRDLSHVRACLEHVDHLFLNQHELARLRDAWGWGVEDFLDAGVETLVESRGADGLSIHTVGGEESVPAVPAKPVELTGAGDAHRAGFLFARSRGRSLRDAVRLGAAVASFAVEAIGPQEGLPTLKQCEPRYRDAYGAWPF